VDKNEKVAELMARGGLEFDCGLLTLSGTGEGYREKELLKYISQVLPELRKCLELRAISVRANALVGQRLWSPEFGEGTVAGGDAGSGLTASFEKKGTGRSMTIAVSASEVLIILDKKLDKKTGTNPIPIDEAKSEEQPKAEKSKGFIDRMLGRGGE
jgi:hypothetical protein